jgi:hypothetical protein
MYACCGGRRDAAEGRSHAVMAVLLGSVRRPSAAAQLPVLVTAGPQLAYHAYNTVHVVNKALLRSRHNMLVLLHLTTCRCHLLSHGDCRPSSPATLEGSAR